MILFFNPNIRLAGKYVFVDVYEYAYEDMEVYVSSKRTERVHVRVLVLVRRVRERLLIRYVYRYVYIYVYEGVSTYVYEGVSTYLYKYVYQYIKRVRPRVRERVSDRVRERKSVGVRAPILTQGLTVRYAWRAIVSRVILSKAISLSVFPER